MANDFSSIEPQGKKILNLLNDNLTNIEPLYTNRGLWIKYFSHSNLLYAKATHAITNYTLIREYHLRFFLREKFSCLYRSYPIKSRYHIFYKCRRFNKYWNLMRNTISKFISFLEFNPNAFFFGESII